MRPQQQQVEVDLAVRPRGENYSTSRGEYFAKMVELSKSTNVVTEPYYRRWGRGGVWCVCVCVCGGGVGCSTKFTLLEKVLRGSRHCSDVTASFFAVG